ncbi:MAG TPA: hypothetical protein VJW23_15455 [Propionibacteriaceae bacterium]|nr:hypothetical protein [Propionibacteriaceae bacterium]
MADPVFKLGGMLRTEPGPKGITIWSVETVGHGYVTVWGLIADGGAWTAEPLDNLTVLEYHDVTVYPA